MTDERAQSELVGTIVLVALVVIGMTSLGVLGLSQFTAKSTHHGTLLTLEPTVTAQNVTLVDAGGDPVATSDLEIILRGPGGVTR